MVSTQFQGILKEFEPYFKCQMVSDENESCLVHMGIGLEVQIELNSYGLLLIGCKLGPLIGRYQDAIFKEALKANELTPPSSGVFGFSQKSKNLILFILIDPKTLKPEMVSVLMDPFIAKAKLWADAIAQGIIPSASPDGKGKEKSDNVFGLQR